MTRISNLHAHIYNSSGSEVGIVDHIIDWQVTDIYDGAGRFSLTCWAKKSNAILLLPGYRADVYGTINGNEQLLSSGIIDSPAPDPNKLGGSTADISGLTRLGELGERLIVAQNILEQKWMPIDAKGRVVRIWLSYWSGTGAPHWWERDMVELYDGNPATNAQVVLSYIQDGWQNWLYVGYDDMFDAAEFTLQSATTSNGHILAQYFNGTGWIDLTGISDGTAVGGYTMKQNGSVSWTRPTDWKRTTPTEASGNWYWVRFYTDVQALDNLYVSEVRVYADQPTTNGLNLIMAYAPDGWKKSGYAGTPSEAYGSVVDMSVLQALTWLRDQVGGHFKASLVGSTMQIDWITSFGDSGFIADGAAE